MKFVFQKDFKPSQFQHVGVHSSLNGKIQKLTDKNFKGDISEINKEPNDNPKLKFHFSSMAVHQSYTLDKSGFCIILLARQLFRNF